MKNFKTCSIYCPSFGEIEAMDQRSLNCPGRPCSVVEPVRFGLDPAPAPYAIDIPLAPALTPSSTFFIKSIYKKKSAQVPAK